VKFTHPENCGNAPKKLLLIQLYKAIAFADAQFLLESLEEAVVLEIVGDRTVKGKDDVISEIKGFADRDLTGVHIGDVLTHGNVAAAYGTLSFRDFSVEFCDVYKFGRFGPKAKITEIRSYRIPAKL